MAVQREVVSFPLDRESDSSSRPLFGVLLGLCLGHSQRAKVQRGT